MADDTATTASEETQITFNVKQSTDKKHVVTVPATSTVAELKAKLATPEFTDIPAERQRLIYSGRVLKDHDTLTGVKIKDGHTVHLVSSAASNTRQNPANQGATNTAGGSGTSTPQLPQMATGTGNNPLAGLTGARYAGFHGLPGAEMFGPDGGMGPQAGPEQLLEMMENPMFLSQMNEAMNNPAVIEMMTQSPMIRNNPMLADMIRNPEMRRMMFNPEMMRMQLQMQRAMGGGGPSFPAPGVTDTTPQPSSTATGAGATATPTQPNTTGSTQPQDPFGGFFGNAGGTAGAGNPFAALFGQPGANPFAPQTQAQNNSTPAGTNSNTGSTPNADGTQARDENASSPPPNPFGNLFGTPAPGQANPLAEMTRNLMQNPEAMRQAMNMFGGMGGNAFGTPQNQDPSATPGMNNPAANPFAGLFGQGGFGGAGGFGAGGAGFGTPPQDTRPPEEVYETQLAQLNTMGFTDFDRNVRALRRSGGNVNGAVEWLLSEGS